MENSETGSSSGIWRITVLALEDDGNDALLLRRAWSKAAIIAHLRILEDGERGRAYLAGEGEFADRDLHPLPRLLLLDLKLPRLSGFEVLAWMRASSPARYLPVIVFTSSNQITDIERAYRLGANAYVEKPLGMDALVEAVRSLTDFWIFQNHPLLSETSP